MIRTLLLTRWQLLHAEDGEFALASTQRDDLVECEQDGGSSKVVGEVGLLEQSHTAVEQSEHVEQVEEFVRHPERIEDVRPHQWLGKDVHDTDDSNEEDTSRTYNMTQMTAMRRTPVAPTT